MAHPVLRDFLIRPSMNALTAQFWRFDAQCRIVLDQIDRDAIAQHVP